MISSYTLLLNPFPHLSAPPLSLTLVSSPTPQNCISLLASSPCILSPLSSLGITYNKLYICTFRFFATLSASAQIRFTSSVAIPRNFVSAYSVYASTPVSHIKSVIAPICFIFLSFGQGPITCLNVETCEASVSELWVPQLNEDPIRGHPQTRPSQALRAAIPPSPGAAL